MKYNCDLNAFKPKCLVVLLELICVSRKLLFTSLALCFYIQGVNGAEIENIIPDVSPAPFYHMAFSEVVCKSTDIYFVQLCESCSEE